LTERKEMATPTRAKTMPPKKLQPSKPPPLPGLTGTGVVTLGVTDVDVTVVVVVVGVDVVVLVAGVSVEVEVVVVVLEDVVFWVDVVGGGNVVEVVVLGVVALSGSNPLSGGTMVVKSSMGSFSPSTKPCPSSSTMSVLGVVSTFSSLASSATEAFSVGLSGRARAQQVIKRRARNMRYVSMVRFCPRRDCGS